MFMADLVKGFESQRFIAKSDGSRLVIRATERDARWKHHHMRSQNPIKVRLGA